MPINSFENYVLNWKPDKSLLKSPLYISLAEQMETDIATGKLKADTKLPPQRELADYLDVSLNTVTRAYGLCEKRGLIYAVTGKGTFVNSTINTKKTIIEKNNSAIINISSTVTLQPNTEMMAEIFHRIFSEKDFVNNFRYTHPFGTERQLAAAAKWLKLFGITEDRNILYTNGSQNSLTLILTSLFESGDKIVVDQYTYPNFLGLANMLNISLVPVPSDESGMDAAELAKVLNTNNIRGIYLSPSCSNPQAKCMPVERRKSIAQLIDENKLILIEDDCYAFTTKNKLPPVKTMINGNGLYLTEFNKAISPVINAGIICYDDSFRNRLEQASYNCNLVVDWLSAQTATMAIEDRLYEKTIQAHMEKIRERNRVYSSFFPLTNYDSYYQWLPLPQGISSTVFESVAMKAGVKVYGSERFLTGDCGGKYFLRISPSAPDTQKELKTALTIIKRIIDDIHNGQSDINYTV